MWYNVYMVWCVLPAIYTFLFVVDRRFWKTAIFVKKTKYAMDNYIKI